MTTYLTERLAPEFQRLPQLPSTEEVIAGLQEMQTQAHQAYLDEHQRPRLWDSGITQAIYNIGITAIAKEAIGLRPHVTKGRIVGSFWLLYEREDLKKFIQEDPANRSFLLDTLIFDTDRMTEKRIVSRIYGAIRENKNYGPYEFAARVSTRQTIAQLYNEKYTSIN